jgi:hypothetical protein
MQRIKLIALVVGGFVMASTAALGQEAQPAAAPQRAQPQAKAADDPNEIVCRPGDPILGSRLPTARICRTRKEWDQIQRDSASVLFHEQMERSSNCSPHASC